MNMKATEGVNDRTAEKSTAEAGRWLFTKIRDDKWHGWWYQYSCSKCGWTTRDSVSKLDHCPSCGTPTHPPDHKSVK